MFGELGRGMLDGVRGAAYLARRPRLWIWVLAPAVVAGVILIVAIGGIVGALSVPISAIAAVRPGTWGHNLMELVAAVALTIASITIFLSFAALIAGPFNERLSETIEEIETGAPSPRFRVGRFLFELAMGIAHAVRRTVVYVVLVLALVVVGLIVPIVGTPIAAAGSAWVTARYASYEAYDAILARRHWSYRAKTSYLTEHRWRTIGLGGFMAVMLAVPVLNIIGLAIGAVGATLRVLDEDRRERQPSDRLAE